MLSIRCPSLCSGTLFMRRSIQVKRSRGASCSNTHWSRDVYAADTLWCGGLEATLDRMIVHYSVQKTPIQKYTFNHCHLVHTWWRHQMETLPVLLAICTGNSPVTGEFPTQRPVTGSFDVFFDLRLNEPLSKQSLGWWFETPSRPLCRHSNQIE